MKKNRIINGLLISAFFFSVTLASAQTRMPDELNTAAIREQIEYVEDHTRIYDNFRAIREDIFQKLNKNILDSLTAVKNKVAELKGDTANLISRTDSLNVLLTSTRSQLEEVTATKKQDQGIRHGDKQNNLQHHHVDTGGRIDTAHGAGLPGL